MGRFENINGKRFNCFLVYIWLLFLKLSQTFNENYLYDLGRKN